MVYSHLCKSVENNKRRVQKSLIENEIINCSQGQKKKMKQRNKLLYVLLEKGLKLMACKMQKHIPYFSILKNKIKAYNCAERRRKRERETGRMKNKKKNK